MRLARRTEMTYVLHFIFLSTRRLRPEWSAHYQQWQMALIGLHTFLHALPLALRVIITRPPNPSKLKNVIWGYRQPTVFMSVYDFGMWVWFLGTLRDTGRITPAPFEKKCRRANRSFREQVRDVGGTPEQLSGSPLEEGGSKTASS